MVDFDYTWLSNPNALIPGRKPIGNYVLDKNHPFLDGCTAYYPFIDGEKRNLITGIEASTTQTIFDKTKDHNFTWSATDLNGKLIGDVSIATSWSVIARGYRNASANHISLLGNVNSSSHGFEIMFNISGEIWWAHEKDFAINLTGVTTAIGEQKTIGMRYDENAATETTVFVENRIVDTSATGGGAALPGAIIQILSRGDVGISFAGRAGIEYFYLFDHAISDQMYYSIYNDPYAPILPIGSL